MSRSDDGHGAVDSGAPTLARGADARGSVGSETPVDSSAATLVTPVAQTLPPRSAADALELLPTIDRARFRFDAELARGGMGRIFTASDHLERRVAIKELIAPDPAFAARFEREVKITARLQHPSIVTIYEAGRWPSGEPFYAMRLVNGKPLDRVVDDAKTLAARLSLVRHVLAIAQAVAYAHGQRVIHRDLKPANVLVGTYGEVVVIDWGLAKDLDDPSGDVPNAMPTPTGASGALTVFGSVMGTPSYMPVEQANGMPLDARADVYAIGAILYYVLAGREPYGSKSVEQILASVRAGPPERVERVEPAVPRELAAIVAKAMARNPRDRYPTAKELGEDLERFVAGQLVAAHEYTWFERAERWIARHRTALAVAAVCVVLLVVGAIVSVRRILAERDRADVARHDAESRADELVLQQARAKLDRDPTAAIAWLLKYPDGGPSWTSARAIALEAKSRGVARHVLATAGRVSAIAFAPGAIGTRLATVDDRGNLELWDVAAGRSRRIGNAGRTLRIAFAPDGGTIATTAADGRARVWDVEAGTARVLDGEVAAPGALAFSPDGARLVAIAPDGALRAWDVASGATRVLAGHDDGVLDIGFTPDGRLVSSSRDRTVRLWDADLSRSTVLGAHDDHAMRVAVSRTGVVASAGRDRTVRVWEPGAAQGRVVVTHAAMVSRAVFSPDGRYLASGGDDGVVWVWNSADGRARSFETGDPPIRSLAFSPDGAVLAAAHGDRGVAVYDVATGSARELRGHDGVVEHVAFSPDGAWLATAGDDRTIRVWAARDADRGTTLGTEPLLDGASAAGAVAAVTPAGRVALWQLAGGARTVVHDAGAGGKLAFSPRGDRLAWVAPGRVVTLTDVASKRATALGAHASDVISITFSSDGALVASTSTDKTVRVWSVDGAPRATLVGHVGGVWTAAFSPAGDRIASGGFDGSVRAWDVASGKGTILGKHDGYVNVVAWSPDGATVASAGTDGAVVLWPAKGGAPRDAYRFDRTATALRYAPSGGWLVAADEDGVVVRVDAAGAATKLGHHRGKVAAIAISPDARWIASAGDDGTVHLWSSDGDDQALLVGDSKPTFVAFADDGRRLVSGGRGGVVRAWQLADVRRFAGGAVSLHASLEQLTTARVGAPGESTAVATPAP
jgi:WD40 repeat protein